MTVMLCDTQVLFVEALAAALRARDHEVVATCHDLDTVRILAESLRPETFVLSVPTDDGTLIAASSEVRAVLPAATIVLLVASSGAAVRSAFDAGLVDAVVSKTSPIGVLDDILRRARRGGRPVAGFLRPSVTLPTRDRLPEPLTAREREVLQLMVKGVSTQVMAASLAVSRNTVRTHVQSVFRKLLVHHRNEATHRAIELGLVASGAGSTRS